MVELQPCASLVTASTFYAKEHEGKGETAVNVIAEISAELQRERQRNAELMERISVLETRLRERDEHSLLATGQVISCQITKDGKSKRQKVVKRNKKIEEEDMAADFKMKHKDTCMPLPVKDKNVENRLVNWMNIDDTESLHSEILKESDSAADCEDTDESGDEDDEEVGENDFCRDINSAKEVKEQFPDGDITRGADAHCLFSSSRGHDEPRDITLNQDCNRFPAQESLNLSTDPIRDTRKCVENHGKEIYVNGEHEERSKTISGPENIKRVENIVSSRKKHPKIAFCSKEVKKIINSEDLSQKNAQSHTIRKIIVFASLGIRHGCEDMYELDFNHFSILRKGEPYVSSKDPGEHVLYENPGVRRKIFYPNRQNPTLCPVQILEEEKAMRPSDASCPSFLFLCIKYGGRTRNIPQNEYVRQRMGRNKLKSFGSAICRIAMLVHVRSGSFFFKALGITLLFMAGFPDDLVQRETKYRNLDLLQKYYRTDEDAEGEELFLSHSATVDPDVIPKPQRLVGKKMSTKSKGKRLKKEVRKDQERAPFLQSAPSNSGHPSKCNQLRNDSIQTQAITPVRFIASQAQANSSIPNPLMASINCNIPNSSQQSTYPIFPPHPTSSFVPIIYWPPPIAFLPYPHPSSHTYQYPLVGNYSSSYPQPYYTNPSGNTLIPKSLKESWKDDAAASIADNDSKSSSSSTEPTKVQN